MNPILQAILYIGLGFCGGACVGVLVMAGLVASSRRTPTRR